MDTYRLRIYYGKNAIARFISAKNLQKIIERTLRRADAPLKFTEGFNPHPRISFGHPLPVNISGNNECFDAFLVEKIEPLDIINKTGEFLPEGISLHSAEWISKESPSINSRETFARYTLEGRKEITAEILENFGKILELNENKAVLLIRINNFSHKGLIGLLLAGTITGITREIMQEKEENERTI